MGNPQAGWPDKDTTEAKQGQRDDEFGSELLFMPHDQKDFHDPSSYQVTLGMQRNIARLLGPAAQGLCVALDDDGLNVGVFGIKKYMIGATAYTLPGTYPILLDASETTYIWCDTDETVETSTTAWPGTDHFKIAIVTTSADAVTNIIDCRLMNFGIGAITNWSGIDAAEDVDFAGYDLTDVGFLQQKAAAELTIASGVVTPTQGWHTVDTQSDCEDDDLITITADAGQVGRLLLIEGEDAGRIVTVKDTDNVTLLNGNVILTADRRLLLIQDTTTTWCELCRSYVNFSSLTQSCDLSGHWLYDAGVLNMRVAFSTIAAGTFAQAATIDSVDTQAEGATDDLDSVTNGSEGNLLVLVPTNADHTVVVKHGVGADKFKLANGLDFEMRTLEHTLICRHNGTQWIEMARSPMRMEALVSDLDNDAGDKISRCIPYPLGPIYLTGALSAKVYEQNIFVPCDMTIKNATGIVDGVPGGGSCIIDVQVNTASIFANDGERIVITDGNSQDTSAIKNHAVSAGDIITIEVLSTGGSPNGADDAVIVLNAFVAPQTAPQA